MMNSIFKPSTWLPTLLSDIKNPIVLISISVIIIANIIIRLRVPSDSPAADGLKEANLGLLIAYLAHLDLVFASFWAVLIFFNGHAARYLLPF